MGQWIGEGLGPWRRWGATLKQTLQSLQHLAQVGGSPLPQTAGQADC